MKITVCELPNDPNRLARQWDRLAAHTVAAGSELVLLPEMPFSPWLAASRVVDPDRWHAAVESHRQWITRLTELGVRAVIGTRPVTIDRTPFNEGFLWTPDTGLAPAHKKYYLPDETGFWEATWYRRGERSFDAIAIDGIAYGFLICTELWFTRHAREYSHQGVHMVVCPRVTPGASTGKWLAGGKAAAVVSGAYCLSSNLNGPNGSGADFGGTGWIIEPEEGTVLGTTSAEKPFLTLDIDPGRAEAAKRTYPRYVPE